MSIIIPYDEKLMSSAGGFINPNGKIDLCDSLYIHEVLARDICLGSSPIYDFIVGSSNEITYDNYDGKLNKNEFELLKLWLTCEFTNHISFDGACGDFLLYIANYDKVETIRKSAIITANNNPHIRFYNYYLYDCNIIHLPRKTYNSETNTFDVNNYLYPCSEEDVEAEHELREIKEKVPYIERKLFLK